MYFIQIPSARCLIVIISSAFLLFFFFSLKLFVEMSYYVSKKLIIIAKSSKEESPDRTVISLRGNSHSQNKSKVSFGLNLDEKLASCLRYELLRSAIYKRLFWSNFLHRFQKQQSTLIPTTIVINISLNPPQKYPLDYRL